MFSTLYGPLAVPSAVAIVGSSPRQANAAGPQSPALAVIMPASWRAMMPPLPVMPATPELPPVPGGMVGGFIAGAPPDAAGAACPPLPVAIAAAPPLPVTSGAAPPLPLLLPPPFEAAQAARSTSAIAATTARNRGVSRVNCHADRSTTTHLPRVRCMHRSRAFGQSFPDHYKINNT